MRVSIHDILITDISGNLQSLLYLGPDDMDAFYENSKPFMAFLKKQGLDQVLRETKLTLREAHTIVPHVRIICIDKRASSHGRTGMTAYRGSFGWKTECVAQFS